MTDKLDNPLKESLSALVDGEASELELRRVLKTGADSEARTVWQRYQLARSFMRGECHTPIEAKGSCAFSANVMAAIEAEESGQPPTLGEQAGVREPEASISRSGGFLARHQLFEGFSKVAIAASVAFVMLLGANQLSSNGPKNPDGTAELAGLGAAEKHPGDTSAVVPQGYSVPSLSAMTVSSVAGGSPARHSSPVRPLILPAASTSDSSIEYSPELQAQLQRMLTLHSDSATDELGLTIVPISRLSSQDTPKE